MGQQLEIEIRATAHRGYFLIRLGERFAELEDILTAGSDEAVVDGVGRATRFHTPHLGKALARAEELDRSYRDAGLDMEVTVVCASFEAFPQSMHPSWTPGQGDTLWEATVERLAKAIAGSHL